LKEQQASLVANSDVSDEEEGPETPHAPVEMASRQASPDADVSSEMLAGAESNLLLLQSDFDTLLNQHTSLMSIHNKMVDELAELKSVNANLQDENESFQLLLGERTLNGEILGQGVLGRDWDKQYTDHSPDLASRQPLRQLSENTDEAYALSSHGSGHAASGSVGAEVNKRRNRSDRFKAPTSGLDLATELERAHDANDRDEDMDTLRIDHARDGSLAGWTEEGTLLPILAY
jgi:hypothetical protein